MEISSFPVVWWFSNLNASESHEGLLKHELLGYALRISNSEGIELSFLTSSPYADVVPQGTTL